MTWAGPRCVQEAAAILGPQNRIQGRCVIQSKVNIFHQIQPTYNI